MAKLDRLGWAAEVSFKCFGLAIGIRTNDAGLLEAIEPFLPPGRRSVRLPVVAKLYSVIGGGAPAARVRRLHLLYGNVQRLARSAELKDVLRALRSDLNCYIAENSPRRLFVHAGAVGWKGRAIVIPGSSFSGKTTLVREFLRAGATYYSDEFTVLDQRGLVHPFTTPLSIRRTTSGSPEMCPAETYGSRIGARPIPVGCVMSTSYRPGAKWRARPVSRAMGVMALLGNTVAARKDPPRTLSVLTKAVAEARIFKSDRAEAKEAVESVLKEMETQPAYLD